MAELNLSGSKGDGTLRMDQAPAINPSDVAPISVPDPSAIKARPLLDFENDVGGSIANIVGSLASGLRGDTQFAARKRQQRQQEAQMKRANLVKGNDFASKLLSGGKGLKGAQREQYRTSAGTAIDRLGIPELSEMFKANFDQPELAAAFTDIADKTTLGQQFLNQDPTGESWLKFKGSKDGQKFIENTADDTYLAPAQQKANNIIGSLDELVRAGNLDKKTVDKAQADGKISVPELRELLDTMPDGGPMDAIKLSAEELSTLTAERNLGALRSMGISLSEDFEPVDDKASSSLSVIGDDGLVGSVVEVDGRTHVQLDDGSTRLLSTANNERVEKLGGTSEQAGVGLGKKSQSDMVEELHSADATLDQINRSMKDFNPEFLTIPGKLKNLALSSWEKIGGSLDPESQEFVGRYTKFTQNSIDMLNRYINEITGAAIGAGQEEDRLRKGIPDAQNMSPTQFTNALQNKLDALHVERWRAAETIEKGVPLTRVSLSSVEAQIKDGSLIDKAAQNLMDENPEMTQTDLVNRVKGMFPAHMYEEALQKRRKQRGK